MKLLKILFFVISFIGFNLIVHAEKLDSNNLINVEIKEKQFNKNIKINEEIKIDLSKSLQNLKEKYKRNILFEWNVKGEKTIVGPIFAKKFNTFGTKEINLNIYKINSIHNKALLKSSKIELYVYKDKIPAIFQKSLDKKIKEFELKAKESGIVFDSLIVASNKIEKIDFIKKFSNKVNSSNYLLVYGEKDFMFDLFSEINTKKINKKINIVGISTFNIDLLEKYFANFLSEKKWINKAILLEESSKFQVLNNTNNISNLIKYLQKNNYKFINLNTGSKINNILFISKFINNLSNSGFSTNNIYLILIIPFILLGIIIFKHIIGLSPSGILIPLGLSILLFKIGFIITILFFIIFIFVNFLLSKIISQYSLHYSPKIVTLIIINILLLIIGLNIAFDYNIIHININDIILIIIFILISERLINIVVSKEFSEYKNTLINTLIFSLLSYILLSFSIFKTIILTYPEIILLLIPISFAIGKFTGLRVTEYFRFKEIIKSIEE